MTGDFDSDTYRSERKDLSVKSFTLAAPGNVDQDALQAAFAEGVVVGDSQNLDGDFLLTVDDRKWIGRTANILVPCPPLGQRPGEVITKSRARSNSLTKSMAAVGLRS